MSKQLNSVYMALLQTFGWLKDGKSWGIFEIEGYNYWGIVTVKGW